MTLAPIAQSRTRTLATGLEGSAVVCTGAAGAIGREVVSLLAQCGARVMAVDIARDELVGLVEGLPGRGHDWLVANLADPGTAASLAATCDSRMGEVRAFIHMAGILHRQPIEEVTAEDWSQQIGVNLMGTFFAARGFCQAMAEDRRGGSITVFSSQAWWTGGHADAAAYAAGKGGVVSLSRALARSYGPLGVRVNVIAPGAIDTPMMRGGLSASDLRSIVEATPLQRLGTTHDVATATVFVASENALFMTGTVLNVSGGWLSY